MDFIKWTPDLSVGIPSIDAQHAKLVDMLNILHTGLKKQKNREAMEIVVKQMLSYINEHFEYEEALMEKTGYPQTTMHKNEHKELAKKVREISKKFDEDKNNLLPLEALEFLRNWLTNHIQRVDKQYSQHLIANGIK